MIPESILVELLIGCKAVVVQCGHRTVDLLQPSASDDFADGE
jgi:hypothetical protein